MLLAYILKTGSSLEARLGQPPLMDDVRRQIYKDESGCSISWSQKHDEERFEGRRQREGREEWGGANH